MENEHENKVECVAIVLLEMGLSLFGIILNLLIITTLRQDGTLPASMLNCLLLNLCFSNLIISFFVKPISAIYIGYSIFTSQWRISLVFCTLYTVAYQTTWCTFPLTILVLSWFKILCLLRTTCQCTPSWSGGEEDPKGHHPASTDSLINNHYSAIKSSDEDDLENNKFLSRRRMPSPCRKKVKRTVEDGLSLRQKILVIIMWIVSLFFGIMISYPDKILGNQFISKYEQEDLRTNSVNLSSSDALSNWEEESSLSICVIRSGVNDLIDYISISITLILPIVLGPCCILVFQGVLLFCHRFLCLIEKNKVSTQSKKSEPSWGLLLSLVFIFLLTYPIHLYFSEVYFDDPFTFVIFKYFLGSFFILLIPVSILYWERDIRQGLGSVVGGTLVCQNRKKDEVGRSTTPCLLGGISPSMSLRQKSNKAV